jgi:hypothetical protein
MATIIRFYIPQNFRKGSRATPVQRVAKVLQFPKASAEVGTTLTPLRSMLRNFTMSTESVRGTSFRVDRFASTTTQTGGRIQGV